MFSSAYLTKIPLLQVNIKVVNSTKFYYLLLLNMLFGPVSQGGDIVHGREHLILTTLPFAKAVIDPGMYDIKTTKESFARRR